MTYQPKTYRKQGGDEFVIAAGGKLTLEAGASVELPGGAALPVVLTVDIADLSADTAHYVVSPVAGDITKLWSVIDGAVGTADVTITAAIGTTNVTNGVITIATAGSAAGDVDSATPTAANTVAVGDVIRLTVAGGGSGGSPRGHVTIVIDPLAA